MYRKQIEEYIDSHCQDMVDDIFTLCRVNSERTAPEEGNHMAPERQRPWRRLLR